LIEASSVSGGVFASCINSLTCLLTYHTADCLPFETSFFLHYRLACSL